MRSDTDIRVVAVVVAWNRRDLLHDTLQGLTNQTYAPAATIVIDNASTDDSAQVAASYPIVTEVITMAENLGGAGGFAAGIARAVNTHHAEMVWIMDDDTAPTSTALAELIKARETYPGSPAVLASKAVWNDGREHPMNKPRQRPLLNPRFVRRAKNIGCIPIRSASFVSILIDSKAILKDGLPCADFFLWNDDFEYTTRLLRQRVGLYVPASVVLHQTKKFGDASADPGARFVNEVRNKLWTFLRSNSLNPLETVLYSASTLRRWGKTIIESPAKRALLTYAKQGFIEAMTAPRSNLSIFANTPVASDVRAIETRCSHELVSDNEEIADTSATTAHPEPFTVLMSVYAGDNPTYFRRALESVSRDQTLKPNQIVLVQDGPVGAALAAQIECANDIAGMSVDIVRLAKNVGLARALNEGLKAVRYEVVARADADDISMPERFAKQIPLMRSHDLLGAAVIEFEADENATGLIRSLPTTQLQISRISRFRDPFNHPTVVFRRSPLEAAGGYCHCERLEDYLLFARMIKRGARTANIAEPLVKYRIGAGAYSRRGGLDILRSELTLQRQLYREGFLNTPQFIRNVAVRATYRIIPTKLRQKTYHTVGKLLWFK